MNKRAFTTIELLLSFSLVMIIIVQMLGIIMEFKNNNVIATMKEELLTYKNILLKDIYTDLIEANNILPPTSCGLYCYNIILKKQNGDIITNTISVDRNAGNIVYNGINNYVPLLESTYIGEIIMNVDTSVSPNILNIKIPIINDEINEDFGIYISLVIK